MPDKWNNIWQQRADQPLSADAWLRRALPLLPPGRALDVACGRGRNALFMAERGYDVTAVDDSVEALAQVLEVARSRHLNIALRQMDLERTCRLPGSGYDVVMQFFYLQRSLLPALRQAVRPGGVAILRTFSLAGPFPGGPGNPAFALAPGELLQMFAGWQVLLHEEGLEQSHRGGSLAGIVARRPLDDPVCA